MPNTTLNPGTPIILQSGGTTITNGSIVEAVTNPRLVTDDPGFTLGIFELSPTGYSVAPAAGAVVNLYEQKVTSGPADAPDVSVNYKHDYIGSFIAPPTATSEPLSVLAPIHVYGAKYWVEWVDGSGGSASISGWALVLIPQTYGTT